MARNNEEKSQVHLIIDGKAANASLRDLEAAARKVRSELRGMATDSKEFKGASANLERINKELEQTRVKAGLAKSSFSKMASEIKTTFIGNLGANLATFGLGKVADFFVNAWQNAKQLADEMSNIKRTTGLTTEEVKALNSELGRIDTRTSMSDLRGMAVVAGQFGVAKDQIAGFVESVDKMNVAMGMEFQGGAEQVATEMSKLRNIFTDIKSNDIGTDLQFISNAMLTLAQSGVATAPVVADFANRIGGIGIQVGLSTGQVLGLSATLQELNVSAERGGTAVVKILQKMLTESESFAEIAGMSIDSFRQLLNEDLFGAFVKVMEGSKKLGPNATGLAKIIKDLEVQGAGASEVFSKLGTNTEMLKDKVDLASESLANNNNLTAQANEMQNNFAGSVEKVSKSWNKLTSNPAIVSFFTSIADGASTAINWMDRMFKMVNITTGQFSLEGVAAVAAEEGMAGIAELEKEKNKQLAELKISLTGQSMAQLNLLKNMRKTALQQHMKDLQNIDGKNNPSAWNKQYGVVKDMLAEFKTIEDVIKSKSKTLSEKTQVFKKELTDKEKKESAKKQKEAEKLAAENAKKEAEAFTKAMYEEIEHLQRSRQFLQDFEDGVFSEELQAKQDEAEAVASLVGDLFTEMDQDDEAMWQKRWDNLDKYQAYAQEFMGATSAIYNMFGQIEANELARDRRVNDEKRKNLAKQLEDKLITQEQYNGKMAQIQQEEEAKAREIQRKQAERERMAAIFEATIKTTLAWLTAALDPTGVRYAAATAASIQLAALLATPLPEFYQGGYTGMGGNMDSKGGFPAVLHPNEYVINSRLLENPVIAAMAGEIEKARTGQISPEQIAAPTTQPQVVVQSDPELVELVRDLRNNGVKGVWDWDYYERTLKRMDEISKRKGV